jgi:hypothetical protein
MLSHPFTWLGPLVLPRLTLLLNHVVSSEPVASGKLQPHAGRTIDLQWTSTFSPPLPRFLLPADGSQGLLPPSMRFVITPAGLFELVDAGEALATPSDGLTLTIELSDPLTMARQLLTGQRPDVRIEGDAALAEVATGRGLNAPRGERLRQALEHLGPIFVKFGQMLSTRRDLLPPDVADELAKLQDRVPPFPSDESARLVEKALGQPSRSGVQAVRCRPDRQRLHRPGALRGAARRPRSGRQGAAPRHAQRHRRRPGPDAHAGRLGRALSADGKRLKPREVVAEFDKYLHDELDLVREAANAAQLRRNMDGLDLVLVPEMVWDYCTPP